MPPADGSKSFTGPVVRFSERESFLRALPSSTAVVIAEAHDIDAEYRLFLVDAKVVGGSMYRPRADRIQTN